MAAILAFEIAWTALDLPRAPQGRYLAQIGQQIQNFAKSSNVGQRLALADVAPFAWDRVLIVAPYSTDEEAGRQLGFAWNVADWSNSDEGTNLVGFASGQRIVAWTSVSRLAELVPHPTTEGDTLVLARDAAVFTWTGAAFEVVR